MTFHRFQEAEPLLRRALAAERRRPSADRNQLGLLLSALSHTLIVTGKLSEARSLAEEAFEKARLLNGPRSEELANAWNTLGAVRAAMKDTAGAEAAYRQSIAIYQSLTPARLAGFNPVDNLVWVLLRRGKVAEAETLMREAEARCRERLGENNPTHGYISAMLGLIDFLQQDYAKAVPELQHSLATVGVVYPKNDPDMLGVKAVLGLSFTRGGQPANGETYLREALAEGKDIPREDLAPIGNLESALGECLLAQKRYTEAEPLLLAGYEDLTTRLGEKHPTPVAAAHRLHQMYRAWGKPAEAARFAGVDNPNPSR